MSELLPHNASSGEHALDDTTARLGAVPVPLRDVWSASDCPAQALPWLAWALSVDLWETGWSVEQKRGAVRSAIEVQRRKGTIGAVKQALEAIGVDARVLEWHRQDDPGAAFTYQLLLETRATAIGLGTLDTLIAAVDRVKSLRSHLDQIRLTAVAVAPPQVAVVGTCGHAITVKYIEDSDA
ncbi:phage tail protein I [Pacificitalea manganoxidans]|uniref:Phage tail protein I n=1 Tax=Pacificitalea manganoxidans TaxID=1411902 RepID=A0A291LZR2_9RHOB|nr:phage tail protein I [Pacificitalea manganoxidans]ATI41955.1 phage tail protein I [Pacificitalea manganoxidans]MDR6309443.1 phage tail P2-like protein [Pacificitalea manganoxidans]